MEPRRLKNKHTLEKEDPKHRHGNLLTPYMEHWKTTNSKLAFFEWLDSVESAGVDTLPSFLERKNATSRADLENGRVIYLDDEESDRYRVECRLIDGDHKLVWAGATSPVEGAVTGSAVHTNNVELVGESEPKWIFVIDTRGVMFVGQKVKRRFHHTSFVSGDPVWCAGRIVVDHGVVRMLMPYSGHYKTPMDVLEEVTELFFGRKMPIGDPAHST